MQKTNPLPLKGYKLKDREDLIRHQVNIEDTASPYVNEIPVLKVEDRIEVTPWLLAAFRWDVGGFVLSMMP